jgi:hypothetical protein
MTYFANFPYTTFEFNGIDSVVKNVLERARFITEYAPYTDLFQVYEISNGETVQSIANDYYGSATYHWVIMIFNEIHDLENEWPRDNYQLDIYCTNKYGSAKDSVMSWIDPNGNVVGEVKTFVLGQIWTPPANPGTLGNTYYLPMTFVEYEEKLNEAKRIIKIMRPELLGDFVKQFHDKLNG